jgi:cytochrome c oxidase accessory protein FixG
MIFIAIAVLVFAVGILVFTTAFGRLWCGWACPQTVMMEMVFRKIEYLIEGDAPQQRELNRSPWHAKKLFKKISKHGIFFALSFLVGNVLLSYLICWQALYQIITDPPAQHVTGLAFMVAFSLLFYGIFARFREQACTFICPYGRLQSLLLDENSIVVAYDYKRGEQRGPLRHEQKIGGRRTAGFGDCVACNNCVTVCPTGIDIRNGTQMECVHCTACMDACDAVMTKTGSPRGLIRYASLNGIERGERLRVTPRLVAYAVVLLALAAVLVLMLFTRADAEATVLRAPGALFQRMPDGRFSNLYTVRLVNKTSRELPVELRLENPAGTLQVMGGNLVVPSQKLLENSVLIELDPAAMKSGTTPLVIGVYSGGKKIQTLKTAFIGPRN